ncbi:MAG: glycoside hydrolase [Pseudomonadota bacterium]
MKNVFVVPHTHWDRAWYLPFEVFRHRLVRFVDQVLEVLEEDESFTSFTLDGQTVILDDYLEIRPENRERIQRLTASNRIEMGPWYTLPDLMLASGESLIRNIEMGLKHAKEFGGGMKVGYVPDPFGHPAELPQVLAGFGIESFIFMRGISSELKSQAGNHFIWKSASGSEVLAIYQPGGYLEASALGYPEQWGRNEGREPDLELARKRLTDGIEGALKLQSKAAPILLPNGCDHMPIQAELPKILEELNRSGMSLCISTLSRFTSALKSTASNLPSYSGDLLGNVDHPILSSVWSTHIRLKILNRRAEKMLTRYVEPLQHVLRKYGPSQEVFIEGMWKKLFKNQAHDDICGCSQDDVHKEDEVRFHRILALSQDLILEKIEALALCEGLGPVDGKMATRLFLFNPNPTPFSGQLSAKILIPNPLGEFASATPSAALQCRFPDGKTVPVTVKSTIPMDIRNRFLETTWGRSYEILFPAEMKSLQYQIVTIEEVPRELSLEPATNHISGYGFEFEASSHQIVLRSQEGNLEVKNFLSFEWQEDLGDTYSASITEGTQVLSKIVSVEPRQRSLRVGYEVHVRHSSGRSVKPEILEISVDFSLSSGAGLEFSVRYDNRVKDGRLRLVIKPGFNCLEGISDGHFRLLRQARTPLSPSSHAPRAYPGELPYDTRHQGEFVLLEDSSKSQRLWLANRGHPEWELLEDGIALTLHRSIGMLSVGGGRIRGCQAGPSIPTPYAQVLGEHHHEFCLGLGTLSLDEATRCARSFTTPIYVTEVPYLRYAKGVEQEFQSESLIQTLDPRLVLTSCRRRGAALEIRIYNQSSVADDFILLIPQFKELQKTSLDGERHLEIIKSQDGRFTIRFKPSEIITLRCV